MATRPRPARRSLSASHPARLVVMAFGVLVVSGTLLLSLPMATEGQDPADIVTALFTATSAVCVTGLTPVDTGTYWSAFGEGVILALIQVGGFGIMAMASLLTLLVSRRLRLRMQLTTQAETKSLRLGDVRRVLLGIAGTTVVVEMSVWAVLALRFRFGYDQGVAEAAYGRSSIPSRPSTTPASPCTRTAWPVMSATPG